MHPYKENARGRSFHSNPIDGHRYARVMCSSCNFLGRQKIKSLMPPDQMDYKFTRTGWELDPNLCPTCISKRRFERTAKSFTVIPENVMPLPGVSSSSCSNIALLAPMAPEPEPVEEPATVRAAPAKAAKPKLRPVYIKAVPAPKVPSVAVATPSKQEVPKTMPIETPLADNDVLRAVSAETHRAAAKMHMLLVEHFDGLAGKYAMGWSDTRVSSETGLSVTHVGEVRDIAYGQLKEPDAFLAARNDLKALSDLLVEMMAAADKKHDEEMERIKSDITREATAIQQRLADGAKALGFNV